MKIFLKISRLLSGIVFIFSGLVKGIDPMGSMYKFIDYFTAFRLDALEPLAYVLGVILCTAEFIIGFSMLTGIRIKESAWGLLIFMAGFTPLTLVLAVSNPVSDCGCFGDAIHLTNWQTFFKNIIISFFVIVVFVNRNKLSETVSPAGEWLIIGVVTLAFLLFTGYNKNHLPVVDFRPYKTGASIPEGMIIPEGAPADEYETVLIYEKEGKQHEFNLENYPSDDTSWIFIDSKTTLIKKGYTPPIHDFSLISNEGQDMTDVILNDSGYNLFMLSIKISEADQSLISEGIEAGLECRDNGIGFYILTSSTPDIDQAYAETLNILYVDETTMKTIIRSNPGYMVIKDGIVTEKRAGRDLPEKESLPGIIIDSYPAHKKRGYLTVTLIMAGILLLSAILKISLKKINENKLHKL